MRKIATQGTTAMHRKYMRMIESGEEVPMRDVEIVHDRRERQELSPEGKLLRRAEIKGEPCWALMDWLGTTPVALYR